MGHSFLDIQYMLAGVYRLFIGDCLLKAIQIFLAQNYTKFWVPGPSLRNKLCISKIPPPKFKIFFPHLKLNRDIFWVYTPERWRWEVNRFNLYLIGCPGSLFLFYHCNRISNTNCQIFHKRNGILWTIILQNFKRYLYNMLFLFGRQINLWLMHLKQKIKSQNILWKKNVENLSQVTMAKKNITMDHTL